MWPAKWSAIETELDRRATPRAGSHGGLGLVRMFLADRRLPDLQGAQSADQDRAGAAAGKSGGVQGRSARAEKVGLVSTILMIRKVRSGSGYWLTLSCGHTEKNLSRLVGVPRSAHGDLPQRTTK